MSLPPPTAPPITRSGQGRFFVRLGLTEILMLGLRRKSSEMSSMSDDPERQLSGQPKE